ncbi:MAG: c-type cytochrome [Rhodanobacter sp.]
MNLTTLVRLTKPRGAAVSLVAVLLLAFSAGAASQSQPLASAPPVPDTLQQRLAACTTCHGVHGEGSPGSKFFPRLAGKPAGYLARQMQDFKSGLRKYSPMEYTVRHLSPAYMREIAEYFASQDVPYTRVPMPAVSAATLQRGEQLVMHGDASRKIPACSSCHGRELTGVEPSIPGLVGLPYDYISSQLGSWRTHTRATVAPDCMALVASRLKSSDITAVAAWLANHEVPADARAQAAGSVKPPLRCGVLGATEKGA